jgi:copper transport protein
MLVAAAASRAWVRRRAAARVVPFALSPGPGAAAASPAGGRNRLALLRQSVGAEVALAVLVLAVTSLLVNAVPGATASGVAGAGGAGGGPFSTTVHGNDVAVEVNVDPATAGPVDVHIYITDHGGFPIQPAEVTASLTLADRNVGPIDL